MLSTIGEFQTNSNYQSCIYNLLMVFLFKECWTPNPGWPSWRKLSCNMYKNAVNTEIVNHAVSNEKMLPNLYSDFVLYHTNVDQPAEHRPKIYVISNPASTPYLITAKMLESNCNIYFSNYYRVGYVLYRTPHWYVVRAFQYILLCLCVPRTESSRIYGPLTLSNRV